jgi:hypothetical protein
MDTRDTSRSSTTGGARAPLPFERAFVVQLSADGEVVAGTVRGRVEHLSSGTAAVFDTVGALITWMRDAIARDSARPTR